MQRPMKAMKGSKDVVTPEKATENKAITKTKPMKAMKSRQSQKTPRQSNWRLSLCNLKKLNTKPRKVEKNDDEKDGDLFDVVWQV